MLAECNLHMQLLNREGMCTQQWCTHERWEIHAYMDSVLVKHQVPIYQRYLLHESFYFFWSTWKCIELQPQPNSHNLTKELTTSSGLSNPNRPTRRLYIILTCSHLHCLEISICTPSTHVHVHTDVILRHVYTAEVLLRTTHVY